jgi:hypothetical protein
MHGIYTNTGATNNRIVGNYIGTDITGNTALANQSQGVSLSSPGNTVGGSLANEGNVISGNRQNGLFASNLADGTVIKGNRLGTNAAGSAAIPNAFNGVAVTATAGNVLIGGTELGAGNLISGNTNSGVFIGTAGPNIMVQGNLIGTDATGQSAIPNQVNGVRIFNSSNVQIGGATLSARNVISGNRNVGVNIDAGGTGSVVLGNYIGTDGTGTLSLSNGFSGVNLGISTNNTVGGLLPGEANLIKFNASQGVVVLTGPNHVLGNTISQNALAGVQVQNGLGVLVSRNSIDNNGGLGIDLGSTAGVTLNDVGDFDSGPNNLQNFPVISSALTRGGSSTIAGSLTSVPNATFTIELFSSPTGNSSGFGEGRDYLGSTNVTTDGTGFATFNFTMGSALVDGSKVSATAIDSTNNTSEFSAFTTAALIPDVNVTIGAAQISESVGTQTMFVVTLSATTSQNVSVPITFSGSATNSADYSASTNTIVIPAGQISAGVLVAVVNDALDENDETIFAQLGTPVNGVLGSATTSGVTILDDDPAPSVNLVATSATIAENGGSTQVTAQLDAVSALPVTITVSLGGTATSGTDYSASTVSLVIPAGQASATLSLTAIDDVWHEGDESITVNILSLTNGTLGSGSSTTVSIVDEPADPFLLNGNALTIFGTSANDTVALSYGSSTSTFTAAVNGVSSTFSAVTIVLDGAGGNDTFNVVLSSLADTAALNGPTGSITSSNYAISFSNVETTVLFGSATDRAVFNDPGAVNTFTFLAPYSIMRSVAAGYMNQTVGFGGNTGNGAGLNDTIFLYGDSGNQTLTASPTQVRMTVGTQALEGYNIFNSIAYATLGGSSGTDSAIFNGSTAAEVLTATPAYSIVSSPQTVQYFIGFKNVTANSGGGNDAAQMYDSTGNDTFTSSATTASFTGASFKYTANGFTRVYAYQSRGVDTATLNGTAGNDRLSGLPGYVILQSGALLQQVFNFSTVIVNSGAGTDTATLNDSPGVDQLNASGSLAEIVYANGRKVRLNGFERVTARGLAGGVNRKSVTGTLAYVLNFTGTWV